MSANILDMVKGAVSDQIMGQLGGMLGQSDNKKTSTMFETAAQSILGGLIKKASTPQGSQDVFKAVQNQDGGVLDKLGDILGGGGGRQDDFMKSGGGILDTVFGKGQSGIVDAIAKFLGLDGSIVGKLLKLAAPIIMGVIAKHVKAKALDAVGLGSLMGEQKSFLSNAMPSSLSSSLGLSNMLDGASDAARSTTRAAANAADDAASAGGSLLKFLIPIVLLGALAWLGYSMLTGGAKEDGPVIDMPDVADVDFGDFDIDGLQDKFAGITDGFKDVTAENAGGLATKITDLTGSIGSMGLDDLTGSAKTFTGGLVTKFIESITGSLDSITDGGIMEILKPVVNALIEKLSPFK